jgi:cyclophilin family peptidyl-prolyl cis-trans isomerase
VVPPRSIVAALAGAAAAAILGSGCGSGSTDDQALTGGPSTSVAGTAAVTAAPATVPPPSTGPQPTLRRGTDGCDHRAPPRPTVLRTYAEPPPLVLAGGGSNYSVVLDTSCGTITIGPDAQGGPATQAFAALAQRRFYDGLAFFRDVPGYFIQGGDPKNTGAGGPGFTVQGATPPSGTVIKVGDVAMAKTQQQAPGTSGSQFFIVTGAAAAKAVSPIYAIVGHVTDDASLATLKRLDALGVGDGPPLRSLYIWRARTIPG